MCEIYCERCGSDDLDHYGKRVCYCNGCVDHIKSQLAESQAEAEVLRISCKTWSKLDKQRLDYINRLLTEVEQLEREARESQRINDIIIKQLREALEKIREIAEEDTVGEWGYAVGLLGDIEVIAKKALNPAKGDKVVLNNATTETGKKLIKLKVEWAKGDKDAVPKM